MNPGRPISEAPRDGTPILVETMNYSGVPETGGHGFRKVIPSTMGTDMWCPVGEPNMHYGASSILRWFPADTDPASLTLTPRKNWKFIPSNGTDGEFFYGEWCSRCIHERAIREDYDHAAALGLGCNIYLRSMAYRIGDPEYPEEWTYKPDGIPKCTAFERDVGQPQPRCALTPDLFQQTVPGGPGKS